MEKRERDASQMLTARFHWEQKIFTFFFFGERWYPFPLGCRWLSNFSRGMNISSCTTDDEISKMQKQYTCFKRDSTMVPLFIFYSQFSQENTVFKCGTHFWNVSTCFRELKDTLEMPTSKGLVHDTTFHTMNGTT